LKLFLSKVRLELHMKILPFLKSSLLIAAGSLLISGCVVRERVVYQQPPPPATGGAEVVVTEAPPAPIVEVVTVSPGPAFVWIGGCWVWQDHWVWERGHWAHPPRRGAVWVPHHYEYRNGVHVFIRGGWRY
jgi:hypothetical protein